MYNILYIYISILIISNNIKVPINNGLKEIDNKNRTCYYFDEITSMILILIIFYWTKKHENILIYHAAYKTPFGEKALRIIFNKVDRYMGKYDSTKRLLLGL